MQGRGQNQHDPLHRKLPMNRQPQHHHQVQEHNEQGYPGGCAKEIAPSTGEGGAADDRCGPTPGIGSGAETNLLSSAEQQVIIASLEANGQNISICHANHWITNFHHHIHIVFHNQESDSLLVQLKNFVDDGL